MKLLLLPLALLFLSFFYVLTHMPVNNPVRVCEGQENAAYDKRWSKQCVLLGEERGMCQLPPDKAEIIGWDDHVARSEACGE